ncbi:hypothetical protein V8C34DRAFT_282932 [Trichoderma compactum]
MLSPRSICKLTSNFTENHLTHGSMMPSSLLLQQSGSISVSDMDCPVSMATIPHRTSPCSSGGAAIAVPRPCSAGLLTSWRLPYPSLYTMIAQCLSTASGPLGNGLVGNAARGN